MDDDDAWLGADAWLVADALLVGEAWLGGIDWPLVALAACGAVEGRSLVGACASVFDSSSLRGRSVSELGDAGEDRWGLGAVGVAARGSKSVWS